MGCQVMYIVECEEVNTNNVKDWTTEGQSEFGIKEYTRPTTIYLVN